MLARHDISEEGRDSLYPAVPFVLGVGDVLQDSQLMLENLPIPNPVSKHCDTTTVEMKADSRQLVSDQSEGSTYSADTAKKGMLLVTPSPG